MRIRALFAGVAVVAALAAPSSALAQDEDKNEEAKRLLEEGLSLLQAKKYDESIAAYKKIISMAEKHQLDQGAEGEVLQVAHYNAACAYSLKGDKGPALDHFEKALDAGYREYAQIEKDSDLDNVRHEARFKEIIAKRREAEKAALRAEAAKTISPTPLIDLDIDATTIAGEKVSLKALKGKVVVVWFWGAWTTRALSEIPHLVRLREELGDKVEIVGVAYELGKTDEGTIKKLRELADKKGVKWPTILVGKDDPLLKKMPSGDEFPSKLFVDKDGKVRAAEVGYQPYDAIEALVLALSGDKPIEKAAAEPRRPEKAPEPAPEPAPEKKPAPKKPEKKEGEDEPI